MQSSSGGGIGGQATLQSATEFNKHFGPMRKSQVAHCKRHKKNKGSAQKKRVNNKVFVMNAGASLPQLHLTTLHSMPQELGLVIAISRRYTRKYIKI